MRNISTLAATLLAVTGIAPGAALAQATDPDADSPSGVIYEIPLESARDDAAPRGDGSGGTQAGKGESGTPASSVPAEGQDPESSIHSENGFGSSSEVPGASAEASGTQGNGDGNAGGKTDAGDGADGTGGEAGGATGPGTGAADAAAEKAIRAAKVSSPPSTGRAGLLIVLAVAAAAGLGFAGRQSLRKR
jgi:hypothetical protein